MFLNAASSPRRSFNIPININLQGARRRHARELLHTAAAQELEWSRGLDGPGGRRCRAQVPVSSVGEDRAMLLGFAMMAFSVLMFFVVGITMVKPYVDSNWVEDRCVLLQTEVLEEWVDCRGVSTVPCLRVQVNLADSNQTLLLHFDEELVILALECFYIPKCRMDKLELQREVGKVRSSLDAVLDSASQCFTDRSRHPGDAILNRKHTYRDALCALLWPGLMLAGGALLVGLVKLTQYLARLSADVVCDDGVTTTTAMMCPNSPGRVYRLLQRLGLQAAS
ncbi:uncharacterized protein V6R79_022679 [Siganus canaliculatus]